MPSDRNGMMQVSGPGTQTIDSDIVHAMSLSVSDFVLPSERIRGWTSPDVSSGVEIAPYSPTKDDPEVEKKAQQPLSCSPDVMVVEPFIDRIDCEPLFFSRPSSPLDTGPAAPRVFDDTERPPVILKETAIEPCDANQYDCLLDLEDMIADDPDSSETERSGRGWHEDANSGRDVPAEKWLSTSSRSDPAKSSKLLFESTLSPPIVDDWWGGKVTGSPTGALFIAPSHPTKYELAKEKPEPTIPVVEVEGVLPAKLPIDDSLPGGDATDWDDWFTDGNIEIID